MAETIAGARERDPRATRSGEPIWLEGDRSSHRPLGDRALATDVCVVGGGVSGLTIAYLLAEAGKRVVVLDDGPLGHGDTCRTTAHLTAALDLRYHELERLHGEDGARRAAESHATAIDAIAEIVAREHIDCGFARLDGYLVPANGDVEELERELLAARRAGLDGVELVERTPIGALDGPALRFPAQAQLHVLEYLRGLALAAERRGVRLYTDAHVAEIEGGDTTIVRTRDGAVVRAAHLVVATGAPVNNLLALHAKQAPYRTFVVGARVPRGAVPPLLLWDTADPYHYVRVHAPAGGAADVLLVGGEDHKTGQEDDAGSRYARLERWTRERFPMASDFSYRWSGQVLEPVDGLAFIGRNPADAENVLVVSGTSGNGMTYAAIAGVLLRDLVLGRTNEWASLYDPARRPLRALGELARENLNVAAQYVDLVTPGEVSNAGEIAPGEGAIVRRGTAKLAVYRDDAGVVHERSAICPHLGCVVRWNSAERSWDCPCHGSRFEPDGSVVNGPANRDLGRSQG